VEAAVAAGVAEKVWATLLTRKGRRGRAGCGVVRSGEVGKADRRMVRKKDVSIHKMKDLRKKRKRSL
jgi:hypothetical protein